MRSQPRHPLLLSDDFYDRLYLHTLLVCQYIIIYIYLADLYLSTTPLPLDCFVSGHTLTLSCEKCSSLSTYIFGTESAREFARAVLLLTSTWRVRV